MDEGVRAKQSLTVCTMAARRDAERANWRPAAAERGWLPSSLADRSEVRNIWDAMACNECAVLAMMLASAAVLGQKRSGQKFG